MFERDCTMKMKSAREKTCPVYRLSHQEEAISMVQRLQARIVPNHDVSQVVSRTIAQQRERVDRQIEIVENEFQSINNNIENQIFNACRELIKVLNSIDESLSGILEDWNPSDIMKINFLQKCFEKMNKMINNRNKYINDFMDTLHGLEKKRTSMIEHCYNQHMLVIKRLSCNSFEELYEKYLKNYNTIKFSNYRTYEGIRFKLLQLNKSLHRDFVLKTNYLKIKIKKYVRESFLVKFRTSVEETTKDEIESSQKKSIDFLIRLGNFFNEMVRKSNDRLNIKFVVECSEFFKSYTKNLREIMLSTSLLHNKAFNDVQLILMDTIDHLNRIEIDSGESLYPDESPAVMFEGMTTVANEVLQKNMKKIMDIQLFLRYIKETTNIINTMLNPVITIFHCHSKRLTKAKDVVFEALDEEFETNDLKLNILEDNFNAALNALVQSSDETDVWELEEECEVILQNIKERLQINQGSETEVLSISKDLMESALDVSKLEVQIVLSLYPDIKKPISEFNIATQNEHWTESFQSFISSFETTTRICQNNIYERLLTLVSELKSENLLNKECAWTKLLDRTIDGRFDVATRVLKLRTISLRDGKIKRLGEIEEHRNLIGRHIKVVQEICKRLKQKINESHERFYETKKKTCNKSNLQFKINELSSKELIELINEHKNQIHLVASEINDELKSQKENIDAEYQKLMNSTLEYMKSIKMFPEGGNYGHEESVNICNVLNRLIEKISQEKVETLNLLRPTGYESLIEIKELFSEPIKSLEFELDKKMLRHKYHVINKLMNVSVNHEIQNVDKMADSLHAKLNVVRKTFKKGDVKESAKCWSEMLLETKSYIDFLLESYRDIKTLLKSDIRNSIWNTKNEKGYVSSKMSASSKHVLYRGKFKFYDYCKTIITNSETIGGTRFLNNIYQTIFQFVLESQNNAADMASIESQNNWIGTDRKSVTQIYHEIMKGVVKKSKSIVLKAEIFWIFKLSDFFDFHTTLLATESEFKNLVLATYHEESVTRFNETFDEWQRDTPSVRKWLKTVREQLYCKLKPSHGHPENVEALDTLLDEFRKVRQECAETLVDVCDRVGSDLGKIVEIYEKQCPKDVLKATTLFIKCRSSLLTQLDHINANSSAINLGFIDFEDQEHDVILDALTWRINSAKNSVDTAVQNVKQKLRSTSGTIFWPNNKRFWTDNVRSFMKLYHGRMEEVQIFNDVEKSKLVDWATAFIRDVKKVKELHQ